MSVAKGLLYYCCLVYSMSYTCKGINLLDDIDLFLGSPLYYADSYHLTTAANNFNIALRLREINEKTNMIELCNMQNKGWYGNHDKAKYKFEIAAINNHYIPWIEDT